MYNLEVMKRLISFIETMNGIADKTALADTVKEKFELIKDRSVFANEFFAVRFCKATSKNFSNTVLSLSALQKYDKNPLIVCVVTPKVNHLLLANTTFLKKISHSSQELRIDNIKGSFNGSDIMRECYGCENAPENFEYLFSAHTNFSFAENLERLVDSTNNISPKGEMFKPDLKQLTIIENSIERAERFLASKEYDELNDELSGKVKAVESEIAIAAFIDNVNLRGRIIEYLITSKEDLKVALKKSLHDKTPLPKIFTVDKLGDYSREFDEFVTETDIKTKILFLESNPKGYNIDKLLKFLATDRSVYLIYIVAIDSNKQISTRLCSMFNRQILAGTRIYPHWAGRNSRGVSQYDGTTLEKVVSNFDNSIDLQESQKFIRKLCIL